MLASNAWGVNRFMYHYNIQEGEGLFGGTLEMEFISSWWAFATGDAGMQIVALNGIEEDIGYPVNILLNDRWQPAYSSTFRLRLVEVDGGNNSLNPDDPYGERFFPPAPYDQIIGYHDAGGTTGTRYAWVGVRTF